MPSLTTRPPVDGWRFVLQHPRLLAQPGKTAPQVFSSYTETLRSVGLKLDGEPMRHFLFAWDRATRDRACADGWRDVTATYIAAQQATAPKLSTLAQVAVHGVLGVEAMDKAQIVEASGIADSEWRTTIRLLEERKIAQCTLGPRQRRAASNRAYRYTRGPGWGAAVSVVGMEPEDA